MGNAINKLSPRQFERLEERYRTQPGFAAVVNELFAKLMDGSLVTPPLLSDATAMATELYYVTPIGAKSPAGYEHLLDPPTP